MRPSDNDPAPGSERAGLSAMPSVSRGPAEGMPTVLGVETRRNGRWRYGRKVRDERAGVIMGSDGGHTLLPRVTRTPNVPGVSAMQPVRPPQRTTLRSGTQTPDGLSGECQ